MSMFEERVEVAAAASVKNVDTSPERNKKSDDSLHDKRVEAAAKAIYEVSPNGGTECAFCEPHSPFYVRAKIVCGIAVACTFRFRALELETHQNGASLEDAQDAF